MSVTIRKFQNDDLEKTVNIWNEVVQEGNAFPQEETLDDISGKTFFESQTCTSVAVEETTGEIVGLYILHPNNVGRCGHICNASFAVESSMRNKHIGRQLVLDCMEEAKKHKFKIMQFNAVVKTNHTAINLYKSLGFIEIGQIPDGFMMKNRQYEDIVLFYCKL